MKSNISFLLILFMASILLGGCHLNKSTAKESKVVPVVKTFDIVKIETGFGDIFIWLFDETPEHKKNFIKLARESFYTGTTFHRVINNFVIQGGDPNTKNDLDPNNDGEGGPGYTIPAEFSPDLLHVYGAVGAARESDAINPERRSSGSQFYIVQNKYGAKHLDGKYTVFGKVIKGMDVVDEIAKQKTGDKDRPLMNITMKSVTIENYTAKEILEKFNFVVPSKD